MKKSGSLYTFGCSMTSYSWPTWADILGTQYEHFYNWGEPNAGNAYIFNSIIECLQKNNITNNDTIIIMWSSITRNDYYQINQWNHNIIEPTISKNEEKHVSCPDGLEIINYGYFSAIDLLLSSLGLNYKMLTWTEYDTDTKAGIFYRNTLDKIRKIGYSLNENIVIKIAEQTVLNLYNRMAGTDWPKCEDIFNYDKSKYSVTINHEVDIFLETIKKDRYLYFTDTVSDSHPTPLEHLTMVQNNFPEYNISQETVNWINDLNDKIINNQEYIFTKQQINRL